ncbi:Six-hairpin glycosidase [Fusarium albosuccineum]|uniref:Six-hairpin glycosidase n=1 Tax=Fusarium albosuccineum TaxID=1237068 RepID=A0A8H4PBI4_9HYPO|nr:Six-hairpin glycosidase [Fusarium albosuccineum]
MNPTEIGSPWIWHPDWVDHGKDAAGGFVHFRKRLHLSNVPATPIPIHITADTRYRLYINSRLVCYGPVKGDEARWFYDTVDIQPFLTRGDNLIAVTVLRYFHATKYATTFARMPIPGLYVRVVGREAGISIDSDSTWEVAIDCSSTVRVDEKFDWFLNIFEQVDRRNDAKVQWKSAQVVDFNEDWGVSLPWRLYPRMIPLQSNLPAKFTAVHNVRSTASAEVWRRLLDTPSDEAIRLPPSTKHHIELETENYLTALLAFRFSAKTGKGSSVRITYSECYEDEPHEFIFARRKGNRRDATKKLIGPSDLLVRLLYST